MLQPSDIVCLAPAAGQTLARRQRLLVAGSGQSGDRQGGGGHAARRVARHPGALLPACVEVNQVPTATAVLSVSLSRLHAMLMHAVHGKY